jgi:Pentapeptide repeats (8 copies)
VGTSEPLPTTRAPQTCASQLSCAFITTVVVLDNANLTRALLEEANLAEAHLEEADLTLTNLKDANLIGAHLERANLDSTDLEHVNLDGAYIEEGNPRPTTLRAAIRNCKLFKRSKLYKAWVNETVHGLSYSRTVTENEDGTVILDRIFTEEQPFDSYVYDNEFRDQRRHEQGWSRVYRHTVETFASLDALIKHVQVHWSYRDVKPDKEEWEY